MKKSEYEHAMTKFMTGYYSAEIKKIENGYLFKKSEIEEYHLKNFPEIENKLKEKYGDLDFLFYEEKDDQGIQILTYLELEEYGIEISFSFYSNEGPCLNIYTAGINRDGELRFGEKPYLSKKGVEIIRTISIDIVEEIKKLSTFRLLLITGELDIKEKEMDKELKYLLKASE
jgi:hypothetical protein